MSLVAVVDNNVLSAGDQREVRHIEFDWSGEVYDLGDVVMVQPQMPASDRYIVSLDAISILRAYPICSVALLTMLGLDPATMVVVKILTAHARPLPIRESVSLLHLTQTCLDFWATPRRYFFELLSQYCRCTHAICFSVPSNVQTHMLQRRNAARAVAVLLFSSWSR